MDNNNKWDELSLTEKSEIMRQAVANGITDLNEIKQTYNNGGFNSVGNYADAIYQNAEEEPYGDPSAHYNNVDEEKLRQMTPNARGHYDDSVKLPNHPSSPQRGVFNGQYFDLTDKGMEDPNYSLFGLIDNGDGDVTMKYNGTIVMPELTVTPNDNYYDDTYNNIRIRKKSDGNNFFKGGGYIPSVSIKKDIAGFEGSSMKINRSFEAEAKDFNRVIPLAIRSKLSQRQLDALYSYGYNVGMGNLKSRVLPTLTAYTQGRASAEDVAASMWASKDSYMRGLQRRRAYERSMFTGNSSVGTGENIVGKAINMDLSGLPTVAKFSGDTPNLQYDLFPPNPTNYGTPIDWSTPEKKIETPTITSKENNNGLELLALINQIYDTPKQEPLATYTPQRNSSMFVVNVPNSNNTFLDSSWFKKGGYLYKDSGDVINHKFIYDNIVDYKSDK